MGRGGEASARLQGRFGTAIGILNSLSFEPAMPFLGTYSFEHSLTFIRYGH